MLIPGARERRSNVRVSREASMAGRLPNYCGLLLAEQQPACLPPSRLNVRVRL